MDDDDDDDTTTHTNATRALSETYYRPMLHRWLILVYGAKETLVMDARFRTMEWVALDGGFHNFDQSRDIIGGGGPN